MTNRRNPLNAASPARVQAALPDLHEILRMGGPRKRSRRWEKQHLSHKAVYRGVDPKLALKVKSIAGELLIPSGEVAHVVIEHALRAYEQGDLDLDPRPNPYRMRRTLLPASNSASFHDRHAGTTKRKQPEASWRVVTTWRGFPPELKQALVSLASEEGLNVPIGELITALLRFGLKDYERGLLTLEPAQKKADFAPVLEGKS
jgi:hypothetical protein